MAPKNPFDNLDDVGGDSQFNEAFLKMRRLNTIQESLNKLRLNLLAMNPNYQDYNYNLFFKELCSLQMEIVGKLSKNEVTSIEEQRKDLRMMIRDNPPWKIMMHYDNRRIVMDHKNWAELEDKLENYEMELKILMDRHGLGTPNKESDEGGFD